MHLWIAIILAALATLWAVITFNRFIRRANLVKEAWSGIDVQLKRRYNLIPNLVSTVKGYSRHEKDVFERVTQKRTAAMSKPDIPGRSSAENSLSDALKTLFALAEAYPQLKANTNFLELQENLSDIEDHIQLARRYYNGTVRDLNILVESFPSLLIARLLGFRRADFFQIEYATQRQTPDVDI